MSRIFDIADALRSQGVTIRDDDVLEFSGNIVGTVEDGIQQIERLRHVPGVVAVEPSGLMTSQ